MANDSLSALELFSRGRLIIPDQPDLGPGKPLYLLAYLGCQPRRCCTRARLIDVLWNDVPVDRARQTLRQTLLQLKKRLGDQLLADGEELTLSDAVCVDHALFLDAARAGDWVRASRVGARPFLATAAAPGAEQFERWVDAERERCREVMRTAVSSQCDEWLRTGMFADAVSLATYWRDSDPEHEPAQRELIRVLIETNDMPRARLESAALAVAHPPHVRRSRSQPVVPIPPRSEPVIRAPLALEMVGRAEAFGALLAEQRASALGRRRVVLVTGRAGIGKTRLLEAVRDRFRATSTCVSYVSASRASQPVERLALSDVVAALGVQAGAASIDPASARILVAIAPQLEAHFPGCLPIVDRSPHEAAVIQAVTELIRVTTDEQPQSLLLEDVHWWDDSSLRLLAAILARCATCRMLVVATSRQSAPDLAADLVVGLAPLSVADVVAVLHQLGESDPESVEHVATALHAASGGLPLDLLELLRTLMTDGALRITGERWTVHRNAIESLPSPGAALTKRLAELPMVVRERLAWLALAHHPLPAAMLDLHNAGVAEDTGLIVRVGDDIALGHDVVADAILDSLSSSERNDAVRALICAIVGTERADRALLRIAGQHAVHSKDARLVRASYTAWRNSQPQWERTGTRAWAEFLGVSESLARNTRFQASRRTSVAIGVTCGMVALWGLLSAVGRGSRPAFKLRAPYLAQPVIRVAQTGASIGLLEVEAIDRANRPAEPRATVDVVLRGVDVVLRGQTTSSQRAGRFRFDNLHVFGKGRGQLWYITRDNGAGVPDSIAGPWVAIADNYFGRVRILSGTIAGQAIGRPAIVHVRPGASLAGVLKVDVLTIWDYSADVVLGAVTSWETEGEGVYLLSALRTQGSEIKDLALRDYDAPTRIPRAPLQPGTYFVVLVAAAEANVRDIASGTHHEFEKRYGLRWNDSTDVARWRPEWTRQLADSGWVEVPIDYVGRVGPATRIGDVLTVVVDPR